MAINIGPINLEIDRLNHWETSQLLKHSPSTGHRQQRGKECLAVQFFIAADLRRYGKIIEDTENAFTAGNVNKTYKILVNNKNDPRNHRSAATESESISFVTQVKDDNGSENKDVTCYKCQEKGDHQNTCPNKYVPPPREKDDGTSAMATDKVKSAHNIVTVVDKDNAKSSGYSGYSDKDFAFNFCAAANVFTASGGKITDSWLLLDRKATEHAIKSKRVVVNIRKAKHGCIIYGSTGSKVAANITTMRGVGRVIFDQDGPANVLSLAKMRKMYQITFDS